MDNGAEREAHVVGAVFDKRTGVVLEKWENPGVLDAEEEGVKVQTLGRTDPIANVFHLCNLCGSWIRPGQKYTRIFFLHNGKPKVIKYHFTRPHEKDQCEWKKATK